MQIKKVAGLTLGFLATGLFVSGVATSPVQAETTAKNQTYDRIKKTHTMNWGVKGDTKLMGLTNIRTGKLEGFDIDMAKAITKRIDPKAKPELTQITSGTRVPMLLNGNIDAIIATMTITPERKKVVDFSEPYFNAGQALMVMKKSDVKSIKDLNHKGARILGVQGSNSIENVKKFAPKAKVVALPDYATALTALESGQGDALTTDNSILYGMAVDNHNVKVVGGNFTTEPYGVAVDKADPKLTKAINKAIDEMKADGSYDKLAKKWFNDVPGMNWKEVTE
ncbi:transporter substrate-binding domain-containing protein [Weissella viridescens]|uniref:transporter substrate-binding domain-containing protein n=1 Tax=Weissella viridescens TaxID=1629 RepID=UPI001C7DD979|nr:transporter substrate-binding domain-containing protein [Weissella viridescens]MBX4173271.1 transporter substrate-binding domain-containing protein [Weissella viridescens]